MTPDGRAARSASAFRMECGVAVRIACAPEKVWSILTDAAAMPRWSSTVTSVEGTIALGQKLALRVPLAPGRVFRPKVIQFEPGRRMVWGEGAAPMLKGRRSFTLTPASGGCEFEMVEVFSGLMLPMIKRSLPDFAPAFERYAADLKREAERT